MAASSVLILTGACGVGKTTTARAWAKYHHGAVVECDSFTEWIYDPAFPHWQPEEEIFTARLSAKVAAEYVRFGLPAVIDNVWTPDGIRLLYQHLAQWCPEATVRAAWLFCQRAENHRRDQQRIPDHQMGQRVDVVNEELASYTWPDSVTKVDTSELSPTQVVQQLHALWE